MKTCNKHRAAEERNSNNKNVDATGIAVSGCARHGCYIPHSVVDFQKGER